MSFVIMQVESEDLLEQVYQFRYRIYVEEMQRVQKHADHARKRIEEPLDKNGRILAAFRNGELVGTIRCNLARESDLGDYPRLYNMHLLPLNDLNTASITTKLMVDPSCRGSSLAVRLAIATYEMVLDNGIEYDLIDCNSHLERFFMRLGYRKYGPRIQHPEYGDVLPMVLKVRDKAHLARVRSPFLQVLTSQTATN